MLKDIIQNFTKQLDYEPVIENIGGFHKKDKFVVCGMGGSNLAAGIIKSWKPKSDIIIHRDYGLPKMEKSGLQECLLICSSYSGNTEETISSFNEALAGGLSIIAIGTGGKLLELAEQHKVPYIKFPKTDNNPRLAIGYSIKATLKATGEEATLKDINDWAKSFDSGELEQLGQKLADQLQDRVPLIYSSGNNAGLARYWKISFNETAKLPAFYNFLPELNHNEMVGFSSKIFDPVRSRAHDNVVSPEDRGAATSNGVDGKLNHKFAFIFLNDSDDEPRIQQRMAVTKKVFEDRGFMVLNIDLSGPSPWHKSFANILSAMWTSFFLAEYYGVDSEDISMIEDFKKSLTR